MTAEVTWVDNHCHLAPGDTADAVIDEAVAAGVVALIDIGTDAATSAAAIELARRRPEVWATVGLHPHDADQGVATIVDLFGPPEVVAVGECGLDYHYDNSPREAQREAFEAQIGLAHERGLTLVIHTREAWDDTFAILERAGAPARTVFHCFTGGPEEAERALGFDAYLSFSGIVTFPAADDLRRAATVCPLDRVLVETDAPFLTPVPHRGSPNRPALVPLVGAAVAEARGMAVGEVAAATTANVARAYPLTAAAG